MSFCSLDVTPYDDNYREADVGKEMPLLYCKGTSSGFSRNKKEEDSATVEGHQNRSIPEKQNTNTPRILTSSVVTKIELYSIAQIICVHGQSGEES